jgi:DNA repair protein RadC
MRDQIMSDRDVIELFQPELAILPHEEFWIMLLNNSLGVIHKEKIGQGGVSETSADVRLIFKSAVSHLASGLVLCHNHPSVGSFEIDKLVIDVDLFILNFNLAESVFG